MTPELQGEVLAQLILAGCDYLPRLNRIIRKLERLLAGAAELREAAKTAGVP